MTDILEQAPWRSLLKFALQLPGLAPAKVWQARACRAVCCARACVRLLASGGPWHGSCHERDVHGWITGLDTRLRLPGLCLRPDSEPAMAHAAGLPDRGRPGVGGSVAADFHLPRVLRG